MGPNGAGKTTLIRIIGGSILPDQGTAVIHGYDILKDSLKAKRNLSIVFGEFKNFYHRLTGRENLLCFASFYNLSRRQAQEKIKELSGILDIDAFLDRTFQEYSSGIKQRFAIARGLLNDAPVVLLDEPTKHLDQSLAHDLVNFIKQELVLKKNKTILMASHDLGVVADISDKIAILKEGQLKAFGTIETLKGRLPQKAVDLNEIYNFYLSVA